MRLYSISVLSSESLWLHNSWVIPNIKLCLEEFCFYLDSATDLYFFSTLMKFTSELTLMLSLSLASLGRVKNEHLHFHLVQNCQSHINIPETWNFAGSFITRQHYFERKNIKGESDSMSVFPKITSKSNPFGCLWKWIIMIMMSKHIIVHISLAG